MQYLCLYIIENTCDIKSVNYCESYQFFCIIVYKLFIACLVHI